jgi:hypothetical protein
VENDSVVRRGHAPRFLRNLFCDCVNPLATIPFSQALDERLGQEHLMEHRYTRWLDPVEALRKGLPPFTSLPEASSSHAFPRGSRDVQLLSDRATQCVMESHWTRCGESGVFPRLKL